MMDRRMFLGRGTVAAAGLLTSGALSRALHAEGAVPSPIVPTTAGKIRGLRLNNVYAFKGIPYGDSTEGARRFLPPGNPKPWTGVRETTELGHRSPHGPSTLIPEVAAMDRDEPVGEDCLVLNVWTSGLGGAGKRPVMVYVHGGGYVTGSGGFILYDGANLARKHDVVVITLNHRLNVFGYLYLAELGGEKYANASNVGMLDLVLALEWVRDNISAFGGDPGNVTLFGQSGGAGKISALLAMPAAKGLFHRAIVESGSAVKGKSRAEATAWAEQFLQRLGLKPGQLDELQKMSAEQLVAAMASGGANPLLGLGPVVDGRTLPANPFDPAAPQISSSVPLLTGTVETEVTFFKNQELDPIDDATLRTRVKQILRLGDAEADRLIAAYHAGLPGISNIDVELILASDMMFREGVLAQAELKAQQAAAPVYMYYFTWRSPVREGKLKAFHTLELPFVFDNVDLDEAMTGTGHERYLLAERMSNAWVAFARSGNPNHKGLPKWPAFNNTQRATMIFNNECKVLNDPNGEERVALRAAQAAT
jgi:para-nitrobenzyl esterase